MPDVSATRPLPVPVRASIRTLARLAWRESRTARRRLLLYMSSISLGVAALVAIDSFAGNVTRSIREQSRSLLGGDLALTGRAAFAPAVDSLLDSVQRAGTPVARVTTFASMAVVPRTTGTRLAQVRAVSEQYPFYGTVVTEPANMYRELQRGAHALVDPSLLVALDAHVGDTLTLGYGRFRIIGTLRSVPGDPGISAAIGPRVFIPAKYLPETQLLIFGSRAEYEALLRLPATTVPARWIAPFRPMLTQHRVRARTVAENEMNLTEAIDQLSRFIGIVGLIALLLGGVGVASGVHAFVTRKIDTVAVLRCLGASGPQVLAIYVTQAAIMGLAGATAGAALGIAIQFALPHVLGDFLPVDVQVHLEPRAVLSGILIGVWVALVFALRPLLALRNVSPLQALRRDADGLNAKPYWRDAHRLLVDSALVGSVIALAASRVESWERGAIVAAGIAVVLLVLSASATGLAALARRLLRAGWPYPIRQGVANLYRPANQTRAVVVSLGFGAFLVTTLYLVQSNLLGRFQFTAESAQANLLLFDVQEDQVAGVEEAVTAFRQRIVQRTPIVTMRIAAINGDATSRLLAPGGRGRAGWALRREYRSTFRSGLVSSETVTAGKWFGASPSAGTLAEVSLEQDVAKELSLELGDTITWDVQGVQVPTRLTSTREVNWSRFEPNFFAVFHPSALEAAPKQFIVLADVPDQRVVSQIQRRVVDRYPNVSSIDLSLVQRTIRDIARKVSAAIRFMAVFSLAMGVPVLFSAVVATRRDRLREGVLLKTLGATRRQIAQVLLAEYALLGMLGSLTGMVLSFAGAWALMRFVFEDQFTPAWAPAAAIAGLMLLITVSIGLLTGRDVFSETPMAALREG